MGLGTAKHSICKVNLRRLVKKYIKRINKKDRLRPMDLFRGQNTPKIQVISFEF